MISTCLSVCRQGWFGVPLFLLGIASLAFSQLVQESAIESLPPDQQVQFISSKLNDLNSRVSKIRSSQGGDQFAQKKQSSIGNLNQIISAYGNSDAKAISIQKKLDKANENWQIRSKEIGQGVSSVTRRLSEANLIFSDLKENFAGRLNEAVPAHHSSQAGSLNALIRELRPQQRQKEPVARNPAQVDLNCALEELVGRHSMQVLITFLILNNKSRVFL